MTIQLTRELLERYLRATGDDLDRDQCAACFSRGLDPDEVAEAMGLSLFRLGLCAAAEMICRDMAPVLSGDRRATALVIADTALGEAEITVAAWEAAQ